MCVWHGGYMKLVTAQCIIKKKIVPNEMRKYGVADLIQRILTPDAETLNYSLL